MLEVIVYGIIWCFAVYGILVMLQELMRNNTYKKIEKNIKLVLFVENVEDGIENYVRDLTFGRNFFNNLVIVDNDSQDDTFMILRELEKENINMKILSRKEGKKYLENL